MNFTFDWRKLRPGMRVLKSGLAVFLVLVLFHFFDWEGVQIAALSAVFSLREDFDSSIQFGASRVFGNAIGGFYAFLFFVLEAGIGHHHWLTFLVVPIFTMLTITTNVAIDNKSGVIGGTAAFLIIALSVPYGNGPMYALVRVLETFVGVFVAILVNSEWSLLQNTLRKSKTKK